MTKEQILGIIRHTLTFIGGVLVLKGITDDGTVQELIGSTLSFIGVVWSVLSKNK